MQEFNALRAKARDNRDAAVKKARDEYAETLVRIAALEQDLLGRDLSTHRKISECIERVIPNDRTFTTQDIMAGLEALDGGRIWRKRSVDNHLSRLRDRGLVRQLKKSKNTEPAVYVRAGVTVTPIPFEDMTLPEVIAAVLSDRPMTQTELVVAMLEAGYETTMTSKARSLRPELLALLVHPALTLEPGGAIEPLERATCRHFLTRYRSHP